MKENFYDLALEGITEMIEEVSDSISKEFKGANPFDKEPMSKEEMLQGYLSNGYQMFADIASKKGLETAIEWRDKMEQLRGGYNA